MISNTGKQSFKWKAMFYGTFKRANINGNVVNIRKGKDDQNRMISFVETMVSPVNKPMLKYINPITTTSLQVPRQHL
jgi:hypothetical protein